jgi:hypothetical protein
VVLITLVLSLPAAYALARLTGKWGERMGIAMFLTYLVPPTLLFIPLSRVVAHAWLAGHHLVAGVRLSELHDPILHLVADGIFQIDPARTGRRGDGRWSYALWRIRAARRADFDFGHPDGCDLHLHTRNAGVRLRSDLYRAGEKAQ